MSARLKELLLPAVLVLAALVVLISLGNWQVERLAWKNDLIARAQERPSSAPVDFSDLSEIGDHGAFLEENEFRPMILSGEYAPEREALVFTSLDRPRGPFGGPGFWVLTPFVASTSGAAVLINRGFVPDSQRDAYAAPPVGPQTIRGLIRRPESGNWFTPEPKPEERIFFARDPARIARAMGLAADSAERPILDFFVDLDASFTPSSGVPQAGETRTSFTNNHLQYAITWYGLAAALLAVFAAFVWRRLKEPQAERLTQEGRHP
ncbi:MAG: SURF1 family protein [Propylenella sp.]